MTARKVGMRIFLTMMVLPAAAFAGDAGLDLAWMGGSLPVCGQGRGFLLPGLAWRLDLCGDLSTEWSVGYWSWTPEEEPPQQDPFGSDYRDHGARLGRVRGGLRWSFDGLYASAGVAALQEREFWTERSWLGGGWYAWIRYYRRDTSTGPYVSGGWRIPSGPVTLELSLTGTLYSLEHPRLLLSAGVRFR